MFTIQESLVGKDYWEKRLSERWGLHGVGHISFGLPYNQWLYRVRRHVFRRHLNDLRLDCRGAKVLDIGSGTGFWLNEWKALGAGSVTGLDITRIAVEKLRERYPQTKILQLDISDPEAGSRISERFDMISMFDVLLHITSDERFCNAISNIAALLNSGGYFIFSDNLVRTQAAGNAHEVHRTVSDVADVLDDQGLEIVRRAPLFVVMNPPFDTRSALPGLAWLLCMAPVRLLPVLGHLYGPALYPLELLLTRLLGESPTTEIVVCRKIERQGQYSELPRRSANGRRRGVDNGLPRESAL